MPRWTALILRFLIYWLVALVAYVSLKMAFNLLFRGFVDLRGITLLEYCVLPVGLAVVYWLARSIEKRWEVRRAARSRVGA